MNNTTTLESDHTFMIVDEETTWKSSGFDMLSLFQFYGYPYCGKQQAIENATIITSLGGIPKLFDIIVVERIKKLRTDNPNFSREEQPPIDNVYATNILVDITKTWRPSTGLVFHLATNNGYIVTEDTFHETMKRFKVDGNHNVNPGVYSYGIDILIEERSLKE